MADRGLEVAQKNSVLRPAPRAALVGEDVPYGFTLEKIIDGIPSMTKFDTRCLMVQLAYLESNNNSRLIEGQLDTPFRGNLLINAPSNKLGKYQISEYLLQKHGYKDSNGRWTGKDGVDSDEIFLSNSRVQDSVIEQAFTESYELLIRVGAIRVGDPKYLVAGMLAVAYHYHDMSMPFSQGVSVNVLSSIGKLATDNYYAAKTKEWRESGEYSDFQGKAAHLYYNAGKYAIQNLAADIAA